MTLVDGNYTSSSLEPLNEGTKLVVIDFTASWCGPCRRYDPVFHRLAQDFEAEAGDEPVAFLSVDVDRNKALAQRYKVKAVPTTVIAAHERDLLFRLTWKEKGRFAGVIPYPRLKQAVREQLDGLD